MREERRDRAVKYVVRDPGPDIVKREDHVSIFSPREHGEIGEDLFSGTSQLLSRGRARKQNVCAGVEEGKK